MALDSFANITASSTANNADSRLFSLLIGLLFWLPIPLGSNRPWAIALFACIALGLLLYWCALFINQRVTLPRSFLRAWFVIGALLVTQAWVFFSLLSFPLFNSSSLDPGRSFQQLLLGFSLTAVFCLTLLLLTSRRRIKILMATLIISGICQAVYGSLMTLSGIEYVLFLPKEAYQGVATGTFINRNHLAGYLELCLAVGIGFMIASLKDNAASNWRDVGRRMLEALLGPKARVRIGLVIMVAALVMTHSRMGNTAFFASMTLAGIIALLLSKRAPKATVILLTSLILIDLAVVGTFFGMEKVVNRIESTTMSSLKRDEVNQHAWVMLQDNLLTGTGAGSFYGVFPEYRQEDIGNLYFDQTHNDYLQFAIELGLIGFVPLLAAVLLTFIMALRAQWRRKDTLMRGLSFTAIMAIIAFGIHSTVDFNLQIPANAATFMVILALGWISMYFKESQRPRR
jgi:O-antigen ligase